MSNLIFDLQRFAVLLKTGDKLVTVQPYTGETVAGAYYFDIDGKYNVTSTFEGDVTISAEFDEVDGHYIITEVDSIALPGEGSGTITTGTGVGTSADNFVEITNLGNSMLTFGGTTLAFDTTDKNSAVYVYGGSRIAYVEIESGTFSAASATELHVNDTYYSSAITIDKAFTYKAGNDPVITISETGANVVASDGATKIIAPAGQNNSITVLGTTLNYSSANAAAIAIDTENASVSGYTLSEIGDKVIVPAALAKNENFVLNGGNIDNSYLPATGYTIEKIDSGYFANGFNSGSLTLGEEYKLTNDSGSAAIAFDKYGEISAVVLGTGDIFAPTAYGDLSAVGDTITLYKDSLSAENKINIDLTSASEVSVTRTDSGISIGDISGSEGDAVTLGGVEFSYANRSGSAFYGDDGKISVNIASGNSEDNRGEIEVDGDPVEITFNDSAWLKVDNRGEAFLLTNTRNVIGIENIAGGATLEAKGIQISTANGNLTINNYTISLPDSSYLEGDMVITVDENGEITQVVDSAYGNEINYNIVDNSLVGKKVENSAANVSIIGTAGDDTISNSGANVTISAAAGDDTISNSSNDVTIDGGTGSNVIDLNGTLNSGVLVKVGDGSDVIRLGAGVSSFSVAGFGADDEIQLAAAASNLTTIEGGIVAGDVTISGSDDIATIENSWSVDTNSVAYNQSTVAGAKLDGNKIIYDATTNTENLFTITGISSTDGVSLKGNVVALSKAALSGVTGTVSISDGYTLALGSDVDEPKTTAAGWSLSGTTATYKEATTSAGYTLADNKISYVNASDGETLVTVSGVKSLDGLSLKDKVVTVSATALNQSTVSISEGYTLALGSDVDKPRTTAAGWSSSRTTATYKDKSTSAGYTLANNKITYSEASGGDTLITVNGIKSPLGLALKNKVVTVSAFALNQSEVSISDGYTLALGSDVDKPKTTAAGWSLSGTTATYKAKSTSAGYTLANNKITYSEASGGNTLVTVSGVKSTSGLALKKKVVTVSATALDKNVVFLSGTGYTLALGSNVDKTKETVSKWSTLKGGNVAYLTGGTGAYYSLNAKKNAIIYNAAVAPDTKEIEFSGVKGTPTLSGSTVKLTAANFNSNVKLVKNADDYKLSLSGDFKNKTLTGSANADTITSGGSNLVINGGKGDDSITGGANVDKIAGDAGDDTLRGGKGNDSLNGGKGDDYLDGGDNNDKLLGEAGDDTLVGGKGNDTFTGGKGNDVFIYSAGNDIITDFAAGDKISIGAAISSTSIKGSDATFTISKNNTLTVKNGKGKEITVINAKGKEQTLIGGALIVSKSATLESWREVGDASALTKAVKIIGNAKANTLSGGSKNDTLSGAGGADKLYGNAGNDSLSGGAGADTLSGGAGNDKLLGGKGNDSLYGGKGNDSLWGDAGSDTFFYNNGDGKDVIYGFDNSDMLEINGTFTGTTNKKKTEVYFKVGSTSNAITLKNFTATTFNINDTDYKISGTKLVKK